MNLEPFHMFLEVLSESTRFNQLNVDLENFVSTISFKLIHQPSMFLSDSAAIPVVP